MDANQGIDIHSLGKQWIYHIEISSAEVVPAGELMAYLGRRQFQHAENQYRKKNRNKTLAGAPGSE